MIIKFNKKNILHWIYLSLGLKYFILVIRSFLPFVLPEVWRQYDTMGISLRYWSRWSLESFPQNFGFLEKYILPAILNSGDFFGIVPMEFPILNILTAPFFVFGHEIGRSLASSFLYLLTFALTIINAKIWKGKKIFGLQAYPAFLLLPLFSVGLTWSCKFMPDYLSLLFVCMGIALIWKNTPTKKNIWLSLLFCSLGLLLKPTSVIIFALLIGNSWLFKGKNKTRDFGQFRPLFIPFVVVSISSSLSFFYFTKIKEWIGKFQDVPDTFYLKIIPLSQALGEFSENYVYIVKLFGQILFFFGGLFIIFGILIAKTIKVKRYCIHWIWFVMVLQFLFVALLTGKQGYSHMYYFIGATPFCCLLYFAAWKHTHLKLFRLLLLIGFIIPLFERFGMDLKNYVQPWRKDTTYEECRKLIYQNPDFPWDQGYLFRSPLENFPQLGVCFGERQGSQKNKFGFSYLGNLPKECRVVDEMNQFILFQCS